MTKIPKYIKFFYFSIGPEGRTAFEQAQLGAHGFQGMQIKK